MTVANTLTGDSSLLMKNAVSHAHAHACRVHQLTPAKSRNKYIYKEIISTCVGIVLHY